LKLIISESLIVCHGIFCLISDPKIAVAYIILIDNEISAKGAALIIRRLFHQKHLFVIHIDKRYSEQMQRLQKIVLKCCKNYEPNNIIFLNDNIVVWGGISFVQAELDSLNLALKTK
jgi:hypothetical protein